ncbi:MAG: signal recognition particle subunit, partial [Thermomicrobiales bacterium]|nr:signal recognition particle subunit [Thermomicrobiales bacterium]
EMIPGLGGQLREAKAQISDDDYKQIEAIIRSMTPQERRRPELIDFSRRRRIALGSGTNRDDVGQLLKQFGEMQKMMSDLGGMAKKGRLPDQLALGQPAGPPVRGKPHQQAKAKPRKRKRR